MSLTGGITVNTPGIDAIVAILSVIFLLFISALISGSEVAFFSLGPNDLHKFSSSKNLRSKMVMKLHSMPERLLSTILVANNLVNIAIIIIAAYISSQTFNFGDNRLLGFLVEVASITFILLLFGEILPKVYANRNHVKFALLMSIPMDILEKIFRPLTSLLMFSTAFVRRRAVARKPQISMDDLSDALELTGDDIKEDKRILEGIVKFGNISVTSIMCPRMDVTSFDMKLPFGKILPIIIETGFSRFPVYSSSFDNVKGILFVKDLLPHLNKPENFKWQTLIRPPYFVPETKRINELLQEFQTRQIHMAVVIDEYGGTSGIVTLEDILEEIVGEITDETDEEEILYRQIDERTFIFEGKTMLYDFLKIIGADDELFDEEKGESETLAGLLLEVAGEIPERDTLIDIGPYTFQIASVDNRRIKKIKVTIAGRQK